MTRKRNYDFDYTKHRNEIIEILKEIAKHEKIDPDKYRKIVSKHIKGYDGILSKQQLIKGYEGLLKDGCDELPSDSAILDKLKMKPTRTQSGVTPVTVLTKPFPCPGKCIFCPSDVRMPKSYMSDEPGAQRAARNKFDPYLQVYDRLRAFKNIGHSTSKIELIILGGTWSVYPENYQIWFIKRCFEAMNDFGVGVGKEILKQVQDDKVYTRLDEEKLEGKNFDAELKKEGYNKTIRNISKKNDLKNEDVEKSTWDDLFEEHKKNEDGDCRCVGLVLETRPDQVSEKEVVRLRKLGATKIQIGLQSLDDEVLKKNKRGHSAADSAKAINLLRQAGFKIHAHWMANLYGSDPKRDIGDYKKLFEDERFRPDELKIYPCSLVESADLMEYYRNGKWKPYSHDELLQVVASAIQNTPEYCRLTRVIRDIPSTDIVVGNKMTNFRQVVENELDKRGVRRLDIRSREIRSRKVSFTELSLETVLYETSASQEVFLQYVTEDNKIAGFLRLSFPKSGKNFIEELENSAIIREIHVYGVVLDVGKKEGSRAQHLGLGKKLIIEAEKLSREKGYTTLSVISAIGTREYYRNRDFVDGDLYQHRTIDKSAKNT